MPREPIDARSAARTLADRLEARGVDYFLGGAIALAYWAEPRGTVDVDLNLFLDPQRPSNVLRLLTRIGCRLRSGPALSDLQDRGQTRVSLEGCDVDIFLPTLPFHREALKRRVRLPLQARPAWICSAEDLAVFKMMFFREQDLVDVGNMIETMGDRFDREGCRRELVSIFGERDPRVAEWDRRAGRPDPAT